MSWVKKGINHLVLLAIGLVWVYPFLWMISASFKSQNEFFNNRLGLIPQAPTLDNIKRIWVKANFGSYFLNTVVVTCFAVVLVLIITMLAGYAMGRYKFVGRNLMMGIFVGSIAIPLVSTIIPTYEVVKGMHLTGTKTGLVLAQAGGAHVIFLMLFTSFFASIPMELEEAAKIDGCSFFRIFFNIMMPLCKPIATTVVIMETIWTWNAFMLPLVLTLNNPASRTLAVGLYAFKGENTVDWTGIAAGGTIAVIPVIILFIILQRHFVEGIAGAVKS
ncbi:carbohydrate ABC transporter permease [Enterocloster clostridioformis]|uniref:carbohydrate ABC transporter permease n=1 Tax=Enterocloster clostridioformis TaxID=1531 RepID=UPI00080C73BE|nr:carbohydrate ABC transporter permease [Enterocloster clostridioformis]ANU46269.1 sugar permease [Lachnoclostridium sp. YL32]NDO31129.1 carbohydrate ABC transporter permease [Enterocloster clostridioformis]OXE64997.1 carbohydrate ABC transporter permease [Enterocloster clostridioformis]QQQ98997.1 carbohydrate ABC transporter permease [Enterocloster clostridioformis]